MIDLNDVPNIKEWIETHIELIEKEQFDELYKHQEVDTSIVTQILLQAGIDPLKNLDHIPNNYLSGSNISSFSVPTNITRIGSSAFWNCECL